MTRAELKAKAKESLNGKYGDAIVVTLLYLIATSVVGGFVNIGNTSIIKISESTNITINLFSSVVSIVLVGLFTFGYTNYFLKISRNQKVEINELWSKTNMIGIFIIASLLICLFTTLWSLLFIIPGIIAYYSYQMTYYILLDNPELKVMEAIKKSKEMMMGHKLDLFVLHLSFIGWELLGILTCGILFLWLTPYKNVTICNFYNEIKKESK